LRFDTDGPLMPRNRGRVLGEAAEARSPSARSRPTVLARTDVERSREDLFALFVADVEDYAILALNLDGNIVTWNAGAERIKGYRSEEIIGRHFSVFYPSEDVAAGKPERELAIAAAEGRMEDEGWRVRQDGTRFWANVVITALRDPDGRLRGYGKVTRDLTERRAQEHVILDREQLVSRVLAAATECSIIGTDLDGIITIFNTGAERMLGYRADEMVGARTPAFIHDAGELAARAMELGIATGFEVLAAAARRGDADTRECTYVRTARAWRRSSRSLRCSTRMAGRRGSSALRSTYPSGGVPRTRYARRRSASAAPSKPRRSAWRSSPPDQTRWADSCM
jgi:PAS domain S-box-containing protein